MSPVRFLLRSPSSSQLLRRRTFVSDSTAQLLRDRGFDHAVEREKNLLPLINTKNLLISEPSKSLPISIIAEHRDALKIPLRPIEFIRKYPSFFTEFLPAGAGFQPHIKLTDEVLHLDSLERLMFQSESYRKDVADRLVKLLMLCRKNKLPLSMVEILKFDLGLPQDYEKSLIPEFPDYFRIAAETRELELVCWIDELGTSVLEKKATSGDSGYTRGAPLEFPMQFSRDFKMDKKFKKWVADWQKLPYVSPYENAGHLPSKSEEFDKRAVAVLHELLHILVPKKTEKENVLILGEHLGLRSRFKRAILRHPGIFYLSSKNRTYTVILKEGIKRGLVIENHQLMNMRSKYIHLVHKVMKKRVETTIKLEGEKEEEEEEEEIEEEEYESSADEMDEKGDRRGAAKNIVAANSSMWTRTRGKDVKGRRGNAEIGRPRHDSREREEDNVEASYELSDDEADENGSRRGAAKNIVAVNRRDRTRTRTTGKDVKWGMGNAERGRSTGEHPGRNSRGRVSSAERGRRTVGRSGGDSKERFSNAERGRPTGERPGRNSRERVSNAERWRPAGEHIGRNSRERVSHAERGRSTGERLCHSYRERVAAKDSSRTELKGRSSRGRADISGSRGRAMHDKTPGFG